MKGATIRRQFKRKAEEPVPLTNAKPAVPSRIARQLALAHHIEKLVESGKLADYAQAAKQLGITRARLTQITKLLLLAPSIQEQIFEGSHSPSERYLRAVTKKPNWRTQTAALNQQEDNQ